MSGHPIAAPHFQPPDDNDGLEVVVRMSEDVEPDLREIARLVKTIKPLSQMMLHAANATNLGLRRAVSDPEHAVAMLGATRTGEMAQRLLRHDGHAGVAPANSSVAAVATARRPTS